MKIGFIGLGMMGANAAKNIRRAGYDLCVYDLRREAAAELETMGATWVDNPRAMIDRVDCVTSMVFGPANLDQVLNGDGGLIHGDCASKLWIDMTTSSPPSCGS